MVYFFAVSSTLLLLRPLPRGEAAEESPRRRQPTVTRTTVTGATGRAPYPGMLSYE